MRTFFLGSWLTEVGEDKGRGKKRLTRKLKKVESKNRKREEETVSAKRRCCRFKFLRRLLTYLVKGMIWRVVVFFF